MALLLRGKTECGICRRVIEPQDEAVAIQAFAHVATDPLILFNDASFHERCFCAHPLRARVEAVVEELRERSGPGHRACAVCGAQVMDFNDHVMIPRLVDDHRHPVARFRYTHLHRSHVRDWGDLQQALDALRTLRAEQPESHRAVDAIIAQLQHSLTSSSTRRV